MEGGNTNNYKFISDYMKGMMDDIYPRRELFDLINFDGAKLVQVAGDSLELYHPKLTFMLCTFHGGNTCFRDIGNMEFVKNIIRGSKLLHRVIGGKFHHCYDFFQRTVCGFNHGNI